MKDKTLSLMIMRFDLIGAKHWYVSTGPTTTNSRISEKFNKYEDAWEYAKSIAYIKNIEVFD